MHEHTKALLMLAISEKLEELQRKDIGYINIEYTNGVDYVIDGTVYRITINENGDME